MLSFHLAARQFSWTKRESSYNDFLALGWRKDSRQGLLDRLSSERSAASVISLEKNFFQKKKGFCMQSSAWCNVFSG